MQIWDLIDKLSMVLGVITGIISMTLPVWAFLKRDSLRRFFTRNRFPQAGGVADQSLNLDAVLFTVSHESTPRWVIERVNPATVGFIGTAQSDTVARNLMAFARQRGVTNVLNPILINDPDDVVEARAAAAHLIEMMRDGGAAAIAVDVTGGKTPMSVGAFMAAEEAGLASIYVTSPFDLELNKPDMRQSQIIRISQPR